MSMNTTTLQSPQWTPIYSQEIFYTSDLMVSNIKSPKEMNVKEETVARHGTLNTQEINYFDPNNKSLKTLKNRYPFFY